MVRVTVRFMSIVRLRAGTRGVELSLPMDRLGDVVREIAEVVLEAFRWDDRILGHQRRRFR